MCKESLINSKVSTDLGPRTGLPDKILKRNHQRIILAKLESMIGPLVSNFGGMVCG
jgi:hypothetical protein